ncbi:hypothetical protein TNCV_2295381 [Trichonephila clavipes]|nr:hypothetical protein TNCV_2295381 [Trichonephila clavipes]
MPSTSGYNLRPRRGAKGESQPTNEKTQQGGPVQVRRSLDHQYILYIEEQARSRSSQQQNCQERKGGTIHLPVGPTRRRQLQIIKIRLSHFIIFSFEHVVGRIIAKRQVIFGCLKSSSSSKSAFF